MSRLEMLRNLKRDVNKEYDVKFGEYYRANQGKTADIPANQIAINEELNLLLDLIIEEAIELGAMNIDISLDSEGYGLVEHRIGRGMIPHRILDRDAVYGLSVVARKRSGVDFEKDYKSDIDGSMRYKYEGVSYDIRSAFIVTIQDMSMSLRLLPPMSKLEDISNLGFPPNVEKAYRESLRASQGLILVTGATGSGKTTTQYSGIGTIMKESNYSKNIRTVENPVEYVVSGVKQTPVKESDGQTFAEILKMFLRGNPDVILVGEINDEETGKTAIRASTSGHLVMSTLHTNNTIEVTRVMQHYGANYIDLGNALQLVLYQDMEDRLCDECKKARPISAEDFSWVEKRLGVSDNITVVYEKSGYVDGEVCEHCNGSGLHGVTVLVEMLEANYAYVRALNQAKDNTFELERLLLNDPDANYYPIGRDVFRHLKSGGIDLATAKRIMKKQTGASEMRSESGEN